MSGVATRERTRPAVNVPMDPRFEARRARVAEAERRRRRNRLLVAAAVTTVLLGSYGVTRSPLLDVDRITVTGADRVSRESVVEASGLSEGMQLVDVDTTGARRRIEGLVPWVATARVSRSWPGTVRITVIERRAVAQVAGDSAAWYLLDDDGRLLEAVAAPLPDLPTVEGFVPGAVPGGELVETAARGVSVLAGLSSGLHSRVAGLRFVGGDEVELVLRPGGVVLFGRPEQATPKLRALDTVLARVDRTCIAAIDVRVPAKPLVARDPHCDHG